MTTRREMRPECSRFTCHRLAHRHGLCHSHYDLFLRGRPKGKAPAAPVRAHLEAMVAAGMSYDVIAERTGVSRTSTVRRLLDNPDIEEIKAITAARVLSVPLPGLATPDAELSRRINPVGTMRRLRALVAIGYEQRQIAPALNVCEAWLQRILFDQMKYVHISTAQRADALFREWHMSPHTSRRAINKAKGYGWHPPLAWDEESIDDPLAEPFTNHDPTEDFAARIADHRLVGHTDDLIATRMGLTVNALHNRFNREGIPTGRRYRDIEESMSLRYNNPMSKRQLRAG